MCKGMFIRCCGCAASLRWEAAVVVGMLMMALLTAVSGAHAATLTASNAADITAGDASVPVFVSLSNDGAGTLIGGVQMDVSYDPAVLALSTVELGAAAKDAGKSLSFSVLSDGVVRVIIAGLNQKPISDGVIAVLVFNVLTTAGAGCYPVAMTVAQMVTPTGVTVPGFTVPGTVTVVAAPEGENNHEGEGEAEGETGQSPGCAGGTMAPPDDPGGFGAVTLLAACSLLICLGVSPQVSPQERGRTFRR